MQSNFEILKSSIKHTHKSYLHCVIKGWMAYTALIILTYLFHDFFQSSIDSIPHNELLQIYGKIGLFLVSIFPGIVLIFNIPFHLETLNNAQFKEDIPQFTRRTLIPLLTQSIRSLTSILIGLLMFIYPGLKRIFQYLLLPFIVYFEPDYKQHDALKLSIKYSKGILWPLIILSLSETLIGEFSAALLVRVLDDAQHQYIPLITTPLRIAISIYTISIMYYLYKAKKNLFKGDV
jgi:hypothetical protein